MNISVKQISSLEKIRSAADLGHEVSHARLLRGERYSYQVVLVSDRPGCVRVEAVSPLKDWVRLYMVRDTVMDYPQNQDNCDGDYLTDRPGLMPDLLEPLGPREGRQMIAQGLNTFWVTVEIPADFDAGEWELVLRFLAEGDCAAEAVMAFEVLSRDLPAQELLFTQWFHVDCIASYHGVEIYSEAHWSLIDRYMCLAGQLGMNMILTPVITPPLDTEFGACRPNTQLAGIRKRGEQYVFDFSRLARWLELCRKNGIEYFEISHLYSQWGADYAPNIFVMENGAERHLFGWHVKADDPMYEAFLRQFLPALLDFLKQAGVAGKCFFHISDEPSGAHLENYRRAYRVVKPLLGESHMMDALSHYGFYREGLVENPVCAVDAIGPFLENGAENLWVYYCCAQGKLVSNRFLAIPSCRNRILGLQMYKYGIKGFLHWGYNFYYSQLSRYEVDPYTTSSADRAFPSGDPFSVYPHKDGPRKSVRAEVFFEALQDMQVCRALEAVIGRPAVVEMIDREAGMALTFVDYPRNSGFIPTLMEKMKQMLK